MTEPFVTEASISQPSSEDIKSCWAKDRRVPRIAIIGAGISGVAAVIKLRKAGYTDICLYEKADRIGGTWRDNRYPGLSCDVPSYWYSYSFEPNPDWTHRFSYGPEILKYIEQVAKKYDVLSVVNLNSNVTELTFLGPKWRLRIDGHGEQFFDFVISATGILHHARLPEIPGLDSFEVTAVIVEDKNWVRIFLLHIARNVAEMDVIPLLSC